VNGWSGPGPAAAKGPGGPGGAGLTGPDHLRVGDAERDEVAVSLHDHFAQGRLTRDELDERLETTLAARTIGDLREVTRDLPGPPAEPSPRRAGPGPWAAHRHGGGHAWAHHRLRHRPPFAPLLFGLFVVTAIVAGPGWAFFTVFKVLLLAWLALAILGLPRHRHRHR
jgi:hypothetical protein